MKFPDLEDVIAGFLTVVFFFNIGVTFAGQITASHVIQIIVGALFVIIMFTKQNNWGMVDLLLLRRFVLFVGLGTVLSVYITGMVMVGTFTGVALETFLAAGMYTLPVYITMIVISIAVVAWHLRQTSVQSLN